MRLLRYNLYERRRLGGKWANPFRFLWVLALLLSMGQSSWAQIPFTAKPEKTNTRSGNKSFEKDNYTDAEADYKKALNEKNNMPEAIFNLGDAVYQQKRYDEAAKQFQLSAQTYPDKNIRAKAYHNLGNTFLENKKWEEAVKAFKSSLKLNPNDSDTKYNLAYANAMLHQQNSGGQGDKNKQEKNDQQKQNQQQNDKDKQQQQNQQQQADNKSQQQQQQKQQGQQPKLSKEEAERLLQALSNEEQKTNQKVQQKTRQAVNVKILKDW